MNQSQVFANKRSSTFIGIVFAMLAVFFFCVQDVQVKYLSSFYAIFHIIWTKSLVQFIIVFLVLFIKKRKHFFTSSNYKIQYLRGASYFIATILFFYGLKNLPMTTAVTLSFVAPFIVSLLGWLLLKERVELKRWLVIIFGFTGVLIITRPGIGEFNWASLYVLSAAFFWSLFQILSRYLKEDGPANTLMLSSTVCFILASFCIPFFWSWINDYKLFLMLTGLGIWAALAEYYMIKAYMKALASFIAPVFYFMIVWYTIFGYFVFAEIPDFYTILGCAVIIIFGLLNLKLAPKI